MDLKIGYRLRYDGVDIDIPKDAAETLAGYDGSPGVLRLQVNENSFVTIAVGPGVAFTLSEAPVRAPQLG